MEQLQLLHFCDSKHPLVLFPDYRGGGTCCGCQKSVYGPTYCCPRSGRSGCPEYAHHKSCAELPLGLHHPLHPIHPLILFDEKTHYPEEEEEDKQKTKCQLCNESRGQYTYRCYRCDFNLHATCASLPPTIQSSQVHHHPLTPLWKWMTYTCDLCGKEVKGIPNQCALCSYCIHNTCASLPRSVKVLHHKHPLHLVHSSLGVELHQSASQLCQICAQKVNTNHGFYYCSKCNFVAHLDCAADYRNRDYINLLKLIDEENEDSELDQSVNSAAYMVKNSKVRVDGTEIATQIQHFSHKHELKLSDDEVLNNEKCNGYEIECHACNRDCNGFIYSCETCYFELDVPCSLISHVLIHPGHEHPLLLSTIRVAQKCSCCDSKIYPIFRCTTCELALDFKCATLPQTTRYNQHEHPFTLCYTAEDDSDEYYCDICEEERDPKHWFYYCEDCSYPAHTKCIIGQNPYLK
ncbi:hypothetical protein RGQ29_013921 [Quercus rubra]|uniref:C2H2-type domain-containing protein n=1 Tax=Quercus rubra TaxID=3512 RepID=A0AAN7FJW1_QUERU|nr:hypothetical protein RGQ29_013921 [Quercus rubra]